MRIVQNLFEWLFVANILLIIVFYWQEDFFNLLAIVEHYSGYYFSFLVAGIVCVLFVLYTFMVTLFNRSEVGRASAQARRNRQ